jgi:ABC-type amino acid transport substrate-binding protein
MKLKLGGRLIIAALILAPAVYGANWWLDHRTPTAGTPIGSASSGNATVATGAPVKVSSDALKVSLVSFHGYAPGLVVNGNSLTTQSGSIYDRLGVKVSFVIEDSVPTLAQTFGSGTSNCAWRTSDFWAQEQPNMRNAGFDGRAVMVVDNTQGGDAIIAKDPSIRTVEDLAGKRIALLQFTPSHGLTIDALANSSLTPRKRESVQYVYINDDEGTGGVRAAFESGKVDAAALWDPDLALALKSGGHVVYSTKTAQNLIFDVMVCDQRVLTKPEGREAVRKFVAGWMEGVKAARANRANAVQALVATEPLFKQLASDKGAGFIESLFNNVVWRSSKVFCRSLLLASLTLSS